MLAAGFILNSFGIKKMDRFLHWTDEVKNLTVFRRFKIENITRFNYPKVVHNTEISEEKTYWQCEK